MKDLVLVGTICIDNGWYGDRHRIILSESEGIGFTRKGDARKFATKLKKYVARVFENRTMADDSCKLHVSIDCEERESFVSYTYISAGPSISYKHHDITIEELLTSEAQ